MSRASERARETTIAGAPLLLQHPLGSHAPLSRLQERPEITTLHASWAEAHTPTRGTGPLERARAKFRSVLGIGQTPDAFIGDLIRATDAVAARCDELASRLAALEAVLEDIVGVLGDDLIRLSAALEGGATPSDG